MRPSSAVGLQPHDHQVDEAEDARRLLDLVSRGTLITFQTFDDDADRKDRRLSRKLHGPLSRHAETLRNLNQRGAGVFFMVNEGDGRGRSAASVIRVRAVFLDLDGAPLHPVLQGPLRPHVVIQSSPSRFHCYWLVEGLGLDEFRSIQKHIASTFDGDPSVHDLCRVMRLPGFVHQKKAAFRSRIELIEERPPYSAEQVRRTFSAKSRMPLAESIPEGERNNTLFKLARGFVNKGFDAEAVNQRIQKVNAERCVPPLGAAEVEALVKSAVGHPSAGYTALPHALLDTEGYRKLSHPARTILIGAYRRYNGSNDGNISLPFTDFAGYGFSNRTFYHHRRRLVEEGFLHVARAASYSRQGRLADLFTLAIKP